MLIILIYKRNRHIERHEHMSSQDHYSIKSDINTWSLREDPQPSPHPRPLCPLSRRPSSMARGTRVWVRTLCTVVAETYTAGCLGVDTRIPRPRDVLTYRAGSPGSTTASLKNDLQSSLSMDPQHGTYLIVFCPHFLDPHRSFFSMGQHVRWTHRRCGICSHCAHEESEPATIAHCEHGATAQV